MSDVVLKLDRAALDALLKGPSGPVAKDIQRRALQVDAAAKGFAPVDTGRLRSSITNEMGVDGQGVFARIGTDVEYAIYQEFGTRFQAGTPFLRPALDAAQ
jgi:HK97 gp10 family phage protein